MFGIGMPEMILILAVALIVIGPKKLPDLAKSLGKAMGEFKKATSDLKESMQIDTELKEVKTAFDDLSKEDQKETKSYSRAAHGKPDESVVPGETPEANKPEGRDGDAMDKLKAAFDRRDRMLQIPMRVLQPTAICLPAVPTRILKRARGKDRGRSGNGYARQNSLYCSPGRAAQTTDFLLCRRWHRFRPLIWIQGKAFSDSHPAPDFSYETGGNPDLHRVARGLFYLPQSFLSFRAHDSIAGDHLPILDVRCAGPL